MLEKALPDEAPARAWHLVLAHIERDLLTGRVLPGDRLPSERELAATLDVGRSSVREALRVLEVLGLIRTATGSGPQAGAFVVSSPHGGLSLLLRLQVATRAFPIGDVMATRLVLERSVVEALAADLERDTSAVHRILDAMEEETLSTDAFIALDIRFHIALAEAAGNRVVVVIMTGIREAIEDYVRHRVTGAVDERGMRALRQAEHRAIVQAVDAGDVATASQLIRAHIISSHSAVAGLGGEGE